MQEILDQVLDYLKGIWLKRRYIIVATWLICPIAWLFIASMDDIYESEAKVYADTQSILRPLLKGLAVSTNPNDQIQLMVRTLLSRPNLEKISRMTDLDVQADTADEYEQLIDHLRENINVSKEGARDQNIFKISYADKDPEVARNVVQAVLRVFIENTLGENRSDTDSAQKFLDSQIKDYENRLLASESKLTDFKQKYSDVLPNQYGGYYDKLNIAKEQLKAIELSLSEITSQLSNAKKQLGQVPSSAEELQNNIKSDSAISTTFDERIAELESALDSLKIKYTDQHPDVREASRRLDYLNNQRNKEIEQYIEARSSNSGGQSFSENPVIQSLQIQINQLEGQIASTKVRRDNYKAVVEDLENKIHILPEIEAELTALNRDYGITKENYEKLLAQKEKAKLAKEADESTSNIEFRVIEQPRIPTKPAGPMRVLLTVGVLILGLGIGVGLSLVFSQLNPVVTSNAQVTKATGIPVFGIVSAAEHLGMQKWHRKKQLIFIISNTILIGVMMVFIVYAIKPDFILAPIRGLY